MTKSNSEIPLLDLKRQNQVLRKKLHQAAAEVIDSGSYILGNATQAFEKNFSQWNQSPYVLGVGSGTDALVFGLSANGVKAGDEVIVPSFTFMSSALAILHLNAIPVFCDVDHETYTMNPRELEKCITKKTKAVMVVHLFGQTAQMDAITQVAKKYKLKVIEDACQAHGALWRNKPAGNLGDAASFSFYPTKNLGGVGDGGVLTTPHKLVFEKTKQLRNLGRASMTVTAYEEIGWTSRLDSLQAAFLNVKLKQLAKWNAARRRIAAFYHKSFQNLPLGLPLEMKGAHHVYHLYVVRVRHGKRDALKQFLAERGIRTGIYYEKGIHLQPLMKRYPHRVGHLKVTEQLSHEVLALPIYPGLTAAELKRVVRAVGEFFGKHA